MMGGREGGEVIIATAEGGERAFLKLGKYSKNFQGLTIMYIASCKMGKIVPINPEEPITKWAEIAT